MKRLDILCVAISLWFFSMRFLPEFVCKKKKIESTEFSFVDERIDGRSLSFLARKLCIAFLLVHSSSRWRFSCEHSEIDAFSWLERWAACELWCGSKNSIFVWLDFAAHFGRNFALTLSNVKNAWKIARKENYRKNPEEKPKTASATTQILQAQPLRRLARIYDGCASRHHRWNHLPISVSFTHSYSQTFIHSRKTVCVSVQFQTIRHLCGSFPPKETNIVVGRRFPLS